MSYFGGESVSSNKHIATNVSTSSSFRSSDGKAPLSTLTGYRRALFPKTRMPSMNPRRLLDPVRID